MRFRSSRMRVFGMGLAVVAWSAPLAACGSDTTPTAGAPSTEAAGAAGTVDYDEIVPDAEVTTGLAAVRLHAGKVQEVLPAEGVDAAKQHAAEMQSKWSGFEATVRKNEKDLYLQMEDALADVNAGARDNKPDRVERGVKDLNTAAQAYLEKHP